MGKAHEHEDTTTCGYKCIVHRALRKCEFLMNSKQLCVLFRCAITTRWCAPNATRWLVSDDIECVLCAAVDQVAKRSCVRFNYFSFFFTILFRLHIKIGGNVSINKRTECDTMDDALHVKHKHWKLLMFCLRLFSGRWCACVYSVRTCSAHQFWRKRRRRHLIFHFNLFVANHSERLVSTKSTTRIGSLRTVDCWRRSMWMCVRCRRRRNVPVNETVNMENKNPKWPKRAYPLTIHTPCN